MQQTEETLFRNWHWGECIEFLDNTMQHSDTIMLVSSIPDSGKTSLKQELINSLDKHFKIFSMYGDPRLGVASLMRQVTLGFGLPWDHNVPPDWNEIKKAIFSQTDYRWMLCIDDAEKLSWDVLNALINLYITVNGEGSQFSLILFADLSLEDSLKNSVLKNFFENKFQIIHLKPLNFEQMTSFIKDHMGLSLERRALKKIYNASNGIIGKVKQLAISELSQKKPPEENTMIKLLKNISNPPAIRITVCCGLLIMTYALFSFAQKKDDSFSKENEPYLSAKKNITLTPIVSSVNNTSLSANNINSVKDSALSHANATINNNQLSDNQKYEQLYQKLYVDLTNNLQKQFQAKMQEELTKLEEKITTLAAANSTSPPTASKVVEDPATEIVAKITESPILLTKTINDKTTKINNIRTNVKSNKYNNKSSEKYLLQVAKNRYVLQLMVAKDEQSIKKLIAAHPKLSKKIKYFSTKFKSNKKQVWFVAVHGSYANKQLAMNDIKMLPKNLQKLKPIVRNYEYVHKLINNK